MEIDNKIIKQAYLYLKNYIYYDNLNLFLKQKIAEFETDNQIKNQIKLEKKFEEIVNYLTHNDTTQLNNWLEQIDFHILPKQVDFVDCDNKKTQEGLFISNVREKESYVVTKINYLIDAPIALHIIDTLWCLYVGPVLEAEISKDNYGNRMSASALRFAKNQGSHNEKVLFKYFIKQYNRWRDQSIQIAKDLSENKDDVALLSLDLTSYFYQINLNINDINNRIKKFYKKDKDNDLFILATKLNNTIGQIYAAYREKISAYLQITHDDSSQKQLLPIGLASSAIIGNWYLSDFDRKISESVNPIYYGRYVDDILIVIKNASTHNDSTHNDSDPIDAFIQKYFGKILIHEEAKDNEQNRYSIKIKDNYLPIQKDKLILQFYDKTHSRAALDIFKKELDERSSAFKFLPSEHIHKELEHFAYDVLYEGSANKLRSIVGIAENETELAKYLASHITAHRLCKIDDKLMVLKQIKLFFKGKNALQFFRLWEKIFQYAIILKCQSFINYFHLYINKEIEKIKYSKKDSNKIKTETETEIETKIHNDLESFSNIALAISLGLTNLEDLEKKHCKEISNFAIQFRQANLIRHHLVAWPLINYTDTNQDLTDENSYLDDADIELNDDKVEYSPRFIHPDERQLFDLKKEISKNTLYDWIEKTIEGYNENKNNNEQSTAIAFKKIDEKKESINKYSLIIKDKYAQNKDNTLILVIANLKVNEADINSAIRKDQKNNITFQRQEELYFILNSALKEKADLLVLPEVAIPVSWLPFMVAFARRHQIGLIFGLEHWVIEKCAYNLLIEALPFKNSEKYKSCVVTARIKNHYAPAEMEMIDSLRLEVPKRKSYQDVFYHKVSWRGVSFATYNCFELSDITHRVLFKSEIDLLIACVWNKDTNYYQHILESAVRDLHCYTVQANTSQYGGSCVLRPTKTENKTLLFVKGGENACILTTRLDIKKLREFQYKSKPSSKDEFKHLPPGYDCEAVLDR